MTIGMHTDVITMEQREVQQRAGIILKNLSMIGRLREDCEETAEKTLFAGRDGPLLYISPRLLSNRKHLLSRICYSILGDPGSLLEVGMC